MEAMATSLVGKIGEFHSEHELITAYLERFTLYVAANSIPAEKKVAVLLTVIGPNTAKTSM